MMKILLKLVTALNSLCRIARIDDRSIDRMWIKYNFTKILKRKHGGNHTVNDIITHAMLSDDAMNPLRQFVSDKEFVKIYARGVLGEDVCVKTIAVLRDISEVDSFDFPQRCAIKGTHGSGQVILRKNGEDIDTKEIKKWFSENFYKSRREGNYKYLKPKVIVEELVFDGVEKMEFQILHQFGRPALINYKKIQLLGRQKLGNRSLWTPEWEFVDRGVKEEFPSPDRRKRPEVLDRLLDYGEKLSQDLSIVRIDWMVCGNEFYLGEITNFNDAGTVSRYPSLDREKNVADENFQPFRTTEKTNRTVRKKH
jgi:hypothetical protein